MPNNPEDRSQSELPNQDPLGVNVSIENILLGLRITPKDLCLSNTFFKRNSLLSQESSSLSEQPLSSAVTGIEISTTFRLSHQQSVKNIFSQNTMASFEKACNQRNLQVNASYSDEGTLQSLILTDENGFAIFLKTDSIYHIFSIGTYSDENNNLLAIRHQIAFDKTPEGLNQILGKYAHAYESTINALFQAQGVVLQPQTVELASVLPALTDKRAVSIGGGRDTFVENSLSNVGQPERTREPSVEEAEKILSAYKVLSDKKFTEYVGEESVTDLLWMLIDSFKNPAFYRQRHIVPKNVMTLSGIPGVGKTLFAEVLAHEIDTAMYVITYSQVASKWQAESGNVMKDILKALKVLAKTKRTVVLFDEIHHLTFDDKNEPQRNEANQGIRNALQTEMNTGTISPNLIFIGATNYPEQIPPELLRGGRFGQPIEILPFQTDKIKLRALRLFIQTSIRKLNENEHDLIMQDSPEGETYPAAQFADIFDQSLQDDEVLYAIVKQLPEKIPGADLEEIIIKAVARRDTRITQAHKEDHDPVDTVVTQDDILDEIRLRYPQREIAVVGFRRNEK